MDFLYKIGISASEVNNFLSTELSKKQIEKILSKIGFSFEVINPREKICSLIEDPKILGVPYLSGSSILKDGPNLFDCSSLTGWIYKEAGISIPRISVDQAVYTKKIKFSDLQKGDFIFSNSGIVIKTGIYTETQEFKKGTFFPKGVDHVGLYCGDGEVFHTSSFTEKSIKEKISESFMFQNITKVGTCPINLDEDRFVLSFSSQSDMVKNPEKIFLKIKENL